MGENVFYLDIKNKEQYLVTYEDIHSNKYYSYMINSILYFGTIESLGKGNNDFQRRIKILLLPKKEAESFSVLQIPSV